MQLREANVYLTKAETLELLAQVPEDQEFGSFEGWYNHQTGNPVITIEIPHSLVEYVENGFEAYERVAASFDGVEIKRRPKLKLIICREE